MRTDSHRNPTAFTTDIARQAGLIEGKDFSSGDGFGEESANGVFRFYTARLIGDPIDLTIRVIDAVGFYSKTGAQRWDYIGMPRSLWLNLAPGIKASVIGGMYHREGGVEMKNLFPTTYMF